MNLSDITRVKIVLLCLGFFEIASYRSFEQMQSTQPVSCHDIKPDEVMKKDPVRYPSVSKSREFVCGILNFVGDILPCMGCGLWSAL